MVDAFRTDTRNMYAVSVALTQPIYMGGAISAANRMAQISGQMAANKIEATTQQTLHDIDKTYWLVVSLKHKRNLADSYLQVVQKLDDDVKKMISEGVATRADGLQSGRETQRSGDDTHPGGERTRTVEDAPNASSAAYPWRRK